MSDTLVVDVQNTRDLPQVDPIDIELYRLLGRRFIAPLWRGLTRVKERWQAGINVSLGQDCIYFPSDAGGLTG